MQLLSKEGVSFVEVARVLNTDAALAAEVLRMANSPLGGRYHCNTVMQAISMLGATRVSGLVLTLTMSKLLRRAAGSAIVRRCWRHNLACAIAGKEFVCSFDVDPDHAYTAALMHDIGRLALAVNAPDQYEAIAEEPGDVFAAERAAFGIDHRAAGAWIARSWFLPEFVVEAAERHHESQGLQSPIITIVQLACSTAAHLGYAVVNRPLEGEEPVVDEDLVERIAVTINAIECEYNF